MNRLVLSAAAIGCLTFSSDGAFAQCVGDRLTPVAHIGDAGYGTSVAVSGDFAVVGAPFDDGLGSNSGAAYILERDPITDEWVTVTRIAGSQTTAGDRFGIEVDIYGFSAVIGTAAGEAYVFTRTAGTWTEQSRLTPASPFVGIGSAVTINQFNVVVGDPGSNRVHNYSKDGTWMGSLVFFQSSSGFGAALDCDNDYLIVGAPLTDAGANIDAGMVRTYEWNSNSLAWDQRGTFPSPDPEGGAEFGSDVSVGGSRFAVGEPRYNLLKGRAHLYNAANDALVASIDPPLTLENQVFPKFGSSVAVGASLGGSIGTPVVVGSEDIGYAGIPSGGVFLFAGLGTEIGSYFPLTLAAGDEYGNAVAIDSQGRALAGAPGDTNDEGAAYELNATTWQHSNYCLAIQNSLGLRAFLSTKGTTSVTRNDLTLVVQDSVPGEFGFFLQSLGQQIDVLPTGGRLCVGGGPTIYRHNQPVLTVDSTGRADMTLDYTMPPVAGAQIVAGSTWNFQFWHRDGGGSNTSDAKSVYFCP